MEPQEDFEQNGAKSLSFNSTTTAVGSSSSDSTIPTIPPQLLRIIRFFPLKWHPIKRALLRPPSENEIGVNIRLSLAQIMHDKQLISTAEYDALEQQVVYHTNHDGDDEKQQGKGPKEKKRKRDVVGIAHLLKIALSRLPMDRFCWKKNVNVNGLDHLRSILEDYCVAYNRDVAIDGTVVGNSNENLVPLPDQVAEWALLSFCGLVIANGLENDLLTNQHITMESQMVALMANETSKTSVFVQAVKRRVEFMLEPPIVNELSDLNVLCLARFFSYLDVGVTDRLFANGISACFGLGIDSGRSSVGGCIGGNTCLSLQHLSKLMASYVSIMVNNRGRKQEGADQNLEEEVFWPSFLLAFQSRNKQRLELILEQQGKHFKDNLEKKNKFEKYTNLFFQTVEYMLLQ
jgi:hypothetical protein